MKVLYLDCGMGAAGDMLTAALLELLPNQDAFIEELNALSIPGVTFKKETVFQHGIKGTHMAVMTHGIEESEYMHHNHAHQQEHSHTHKHNHEQEHAHEQERQHNHAHIHRGMHEIEQIVLDFMLPTHIKEDILAVYHLIAEAESDAHGAPVSEIHFHEVGTMDAIADITAVCMLMDRLSPDEIIASPIHVGSGQVKCAHGILPVPAPATAYILRDAPIYGGEIKSELCTPTGAALLKHFVTRFGNMPVMKVSAIGYGMGKKEFDAANCVRAMFGEGNDKTDETLELSCNVDDMTAEAVSFAMDRLFEGGAKEVYTTPIGMKKSRPGILICVICYPSDREKIIDLMFKHTTTIGIRENVTQRYILERTVENLHTPYGDVRCKKSCGYGVSRYKFEYEDLACIARKRQISLEQANKLIEEWKTTN